MYRDLYVLQPIKPSIIVGSIQEHLYIRFGPVQKQCLKPRPKNEVPNFSLWSPSSLLRSPNLVGSSPSLSLSAEETMVFYFKARPEVGDYTIFMGLDKYENEELIKYGFPEDVW